MLQEKSYVFAAQFFNNREPVCQRQPETLVGLERHQAISSAQAAIQQIADRVPTEFEEGFLLLKTDAGYPIWSWTISGAGTILSQQCEYSP